MGQFKPLKGNMKNKQTKESAEIQLRKLLEK